VRQSRAARERVRRENEDEHAAPALRSDDARHRPSVVCGAEGERSPPEGCWWNLVSGALRPVSAKNRPMTATATCGATVRRHWVPPPRIVAARPQHARSSRPGSPRRPPWTAAAVPLSPRGATMRGGAGASAAVGSPPNAKGHGAWRAHAPVAAIAARHSARARAEAAFRSPRAHGRDFSAEEQETCSHSPARARGCAVLRAVLPREPRRVPIVGRLKGGTLAVSGQVDRLAVISDAVLIADYKTNRPAPRRIETCRPPNSPAGAVPRRAGPALSRTRHSRRPLWTDVLI
jgi:ATP-dependent helicase/nuclease subunit A